jgi:hypothetical protein
MAVLTYVSPKKEVEEKISNNNLILRKPVIHRVPINKRLLAEKIGKKTACEKEKNLYIIAIRKLIENCVRKYAHMDEHNKEDQFNDLVQDLHHHIVSGLHYYNAEKANITTWIYVCAKNYFVNKNGEKFKRKGMFAKEESELDIRIDNKDNALKVDFRDAVIELFKKNPKQKKFLTEFFGNPFKEDYVYFYRSNLKEIQRDIGGEYIKQWAFYNKVVIPFLRDKFAGYWCEKGKA